MQTMRKGLIVSKGIAANYLPDKIGLAAVKAL